MSSLTSKFRSTPTFTFKSRTQSITHNNTASVLPSPNQYHPEKQPTKNSPVIRFAQSKRTEWKDIKNRLWTPGPGSHEARSYITDGPKKSISQRKYRTIINRTPSPNSYEIKSEILLKKNPSFSFQSKTISPLEITRKNNEYKPSPGDHHIEIRQTNKLWKSTQKFSIGKSKRSQNISSARTPGPGAYNPESSFTKSARSSGRCAFSKSARVFDVFQGKRTAGPNIYDKKLSLKESRSQKESEKQKLRNYLAETQGPAHYNLQQRFPNPPLYMNVHPKIKFNEKIMRKY